MYLYNYIIHCASYLKSDTSSHRRNARRWICAAKGALNILCKESGFKIRKMFYEINTSILYLYATERVSKVNITIRARMEGGEVYLDLPPKSCVYSALRRALKYNIHLETIRGHEPRIASARTTASALASGARWLTESQSHGAEASEAIDASLRRYKAREAKSFPRFDEEEQAELAAEAREAYWEKR